MGKEKFEAKNVSKIERDELIFKLEELKEQVNNEEQQTINQVIRKLKDESKLGLNFDHFEEEIDQILKDNIPVFEEIKEKKINKSESSKYNFLIEGDNLPSLHLLNKTHRSKIDVIYIDPPYNTGGDFIYNDTFIDAEDSYRHSKWLSFMEKRLELAKNLLAEDGLIFISIDDREVAELKILCDSIFGAKNRFSILAVEMSKTQGFKVKAAKEGVIVKNHEYILVYAKNIELAKKDRIPLYDKSEPYDSHFNKIIDPETLEVYDLSDYIEKNHPEIFQKFETYGFVKKGKINVDEIGKSIVIDEKIRDFFYNDISDILYQDLPCEVKIPEKIWEGNRGEPVKFDSYLIRKTSTGSIRQYRNLSENLKINDDFVSEKSRVTIRGALWKGFNYDMGNINKEGEVVFKSGKKPKRLIYQILKYCNRREGKVLDFFAGSGTTAESVLDYNKDYNAECEFILVTNNENKICEEITYKRIKNVIEGTKNKEGICSNLKYYRIKYLSDENVDIERNEYFTDLLTRYSHEMIELKRFCEINTNGVFCVNTNEEMKEIIKENDYVKDIYYPCDEFSVESDNFYMINDKGINLHAIPNCFFSKELKEKGEL